MVSRATRLQLILPINSHHNSSTVRLRQVDMTSSTIQTADRARIPHNNRATELLLNNMDMATSKVTSSPTSMISTAPPVLQVAPLRASAVSALRS